jgi:NADPH-dependent glutamate synthase beta subunit-like oxidoreductase
MLICGIPSYRLPRETINKEIECILNENITVKCNTALGKNISVDSLMKDGYQAVLLSMGAHKSKLLEIENEDIEGVYPSIEFLKAFNLKGESLARGTVGIIGGGNSALDAARMALRQQDVEKVIILYRRTREEMPAFAEEIEAADQELIEIRTLVSPTRIIHEGGRMTGLEFVRNELGDPDASGRRRPVAIKGSEDTITLNTLIVAIGEDSGIDAIGPAKSSGIHTTDHNTVKINPRTMVTNRPGVFAAGDVVTGPNTAVEAIAAGKRAAGKIVRYLLKKNLDEPVTRWNLPTVYIEPVVFEGDETPELNRVETPRASVEWRKRNFAEVEVSLSAQEAAREARRCLRCDLEFTKPREEEEKKEPSPTLSGGTTA